MKDEWKDRMAGCSCSLCDLCDGISNITGSQAASVLVMIEKEKYTNISLCDDCRRRMCTCDVCSAFLLTSDHGGTYGVCKRTVGNPVIESVVTTKTAFVNGEGWFRDCFQQARPLTFDEVKERFEKDRSD